jgi:hypothetical protein
MSSRINWKEEGDVIIHLSHEVWTKYDVKAAYDGRIICNRTVWEYRDSKGEEHRKGTEWLDEEGKPTPPQTVKNGDFPRINYVGKGSSYKGKGIRVKN